MKISAYGIEFKYRGDNVIWVFPWKRNDREAKYLSKKLQIHYCSLKELDREWDEYWEAVFFDSVSGEVIDDKIKNIVEFSPKYGIGDKSLKSVFDDNQAIHKKLIREENEND